MKSTLINETGNRYGRLTVLQRDGRECKPTKWLCRCACGVTVSVRGDHLRQGSTRSCGCYKHDNHRLLRSEGAFRSHYYELRQTAKRHKVGFTLTEQQVRELDGMPCHYCGVPPSNRKKSPSDNGDYVYSGLDRLVDGMGYTPDNVVPCCWTCNRMKGRLPLEEFRLQIRRIYDKLGVDLTTPMEK
jgi:hypothetical protein